MKKTPIQASTSISADKLLHDLQSCLKKIGPCAIAVSGGVDSMTLAHVAHQLDPEVEIYHALSAAVPDSASQRVREHAEENSWKLKLIDAGETQNPRYVANPANRCFYCKSNLYGTIKEHTKHTILSGTNIDDLSDYRPGLQAASDFKVRHPYVESNINKSQLRLIADLLGLKDLKSLPASPCLSSRVQTGINIDSALLRVIDHAESALREDMKAHLETPTIRCRIKPNEVVLEIDDRNKTKIDPNSLLATKAKQRVKDIFCAEGYQDQVSTISLKPYKMGSAFLINTVDVLS